MKLFKKNTFLIWKICFNILSGTKLIISFQCWFFWLLDWQVIWLIFGLVLFFKAQTTHPCSPPNCWSVIENRFYLFIFNQLLFWYSVKVNLLSVPLMQILCPFTYSLYLQTDAFQWRCNLLYLLCLRWLNLRKINNYYITVLVSLYEIWVISW